MKTFDVALNVGGEPWVEMEIVSLELDLYAGTVVVVVFD